MDYVMLKDVCTINMGQSPDSNSYNDDGDGVPFFQGNADFGERYPITRKWCTAPTKMAAPNDILISVRAPIGAMNYAKESCCIGRGLAALTPDKSKVSSEFIFWLMKCKNQELNSKGTGSTFKAIGRKVLEETLVPNITLEKQTEYSAILERVYAVIQARKTELQKLDELVKARFVEMFGDPKSNPNSYPISQLSEHIEFLTSGSRGWAQYCVDNGSEWFITIKNVKDCRIFIDNMQPINAPDNAEAKRTKVQEGDLLISITADLGRTGVVTKEIADHGAYINQHLTCIRLNKEILNPLYVAFFMESPAGKEQFESKNQSAVKAGLNFNSINSLRLLVPPMDEQSAFVEFVHQIDKSKVVESIHRMNVLFNITLNGGNRYDIRANEF